MSDPFVGEIRMFAGNFAPRGWAFCDGQLLAISQNDALFSLFGTIYGGDGRTTFALPDMRGRLPVHEGNGSGLSNYPIGARWGVETVALTASQAQDHAHAMQGSSGFGSDTTPAGNLPATGSGINLYNNSASATVIGLSGAAVGVAGGNLAHSNLMPFLCVNFIVALFGIYPSRS